MNDYFKFTFSTMNAVEEGRDVLISDFKQFFSDHNKPEGLGLFLVIAKEAKPLQEVYQIESPLNVSAEVAEFTRQHRGRPTDNPADPANTKLVAGKC
jgi:hypothetical protein